ncbi:DUF3304 domain-containing protein [Pseudomonas aeruginosa]|uniref:DUF3304 domain-containing protein n=2 Tax=Pseudomonas aeruginosa TaxID=287 RepID=UPI0019D4242E|nr:DUF3304 domain-containing protein [Pseudomonas aeruginosa]MBN7870459.1 DUF3304 domain-containing protein [Pseudomonas aeruginosa]HCG0888709.1 DUF3304 domain-containing protein [Pseudomonas aeruginosa]
MNINVLLYVLLGGIATLWLTGCSAGSSKNIPTPIEGYNHTSAAINGFTVNGSGGPNIGPHQGGRKQNCCISLPEKWRPGMTVVVEWEKDPNPGASRFWPQPRYSDAWRKAAMEHRTHYTRHCAVLEVPPYDDVGAIVVHFLPCDEVKVIATLYGYRHPQYPIKEPLKMKEPKTCPAR